MQRREPIPAFDSRDSLCGSGRFCAPPIVHSVDPLAGAPPMSIGLERFVHGIPFDAPLFAPPPPAEPPDSPVAVSCSSSIGRNSDCSAGGVDDDADGEVQSSYKGPLDTMDALEDSLPIKIRMSNNTGEVMDEVVKATLVGGPENHSDLISTHLVPGHKRKRARRTGQEEGRKRMRGTGQRMRTLPEDLIICEILPRLSVKSLMRFKSVCKSWRSVISGGDSHLITSHLLQSRQQLRALVMPGDENSSGVVSCRFSSTGCQSEFLPGMLGLESVLSTCRPSHCDGLILLSSATDLHVCNPATREFVTLPRSINVNNPSRIQTMYQPYNAAALGYDPLTNKPKVVRFFYRAVDLEARTCSLGVEVLTLGSHSLSWIPVQQDPPYPIWHVQQASTVDGVIYWLIDNTLLASSQGIVSFDLKDGKFGIIPAPPTWPEDSPDPFQKMATLHVLDEDLCCTHPLGRFRIVCIYRRGRWHWSHSQKGDIKNYLPLGTSNEGKMLIEIGGTSFHYYDPLTLRTELIAGSTKKWPILSNGDPWFHVMRYTESMLPIISER